LRLGSEFLPEDKEVFECTVVQDEEGPFVIGVESAEVLELGSAGCEFEVRQGHCICAQVQVRHHLRCDVDRRDSKEPVLTFFSMFHHISKESTLFSDQEYDSQQCQYAAGSEISPWVFALETNRLP